MNNRLDIIREKGRFGSSRLLPMLENADIPTCLFVRQKKGTGCVIYFPENEKVYAFYTFANTGNVLHLLTSLPDFRSRWKEENTKMMITRLRNALLVKNREMRAKFFWNSNGGPLSRVLREFYDLTNQQIFIIMSVIMSVKFSNMRN